jgi:hypothetical protein
LNSLFDVTVKSQKNAAKTTATLQNRGGKVLLTLASSFGKIKKVKCGAAKKEVFFRYSQNLSTPQPLGRYQKIQIFDLTDPM